MLTEENMFYILKECEVTKNEVRIEEFMGEEGKGFELMKR